MKTAIFALGLIGVVFGQTNQCTSAGDRNAIGGGDAVTRVAQQCAVQCLFENDFPSCVSKCAVTTINVSGQCSQCFGIGATCAMDACMMKCFDPSAAECNQCVQESCLPKIDQCTGIPSRVLAPVRPAVIEIAEGQCTGDNDRNAIGSGDAVTRVSQNCAVQCLFENDFPGCVSRCATATIGVSGACSQCFGTGATCAMDACMMKCFDPSAAECNDCVQNSCLPVIDQCTGIPSRGIVANIPQEDGKCRSASDQKAMFDQSAVEKAAQNCGKKCIFNLKFSDCVATCAQTDVKVSADCSTCFAGGAACTMKKCLLPCVDISSPKCRTCSEEKCAPDMAKCTGIPLKVHKD